MSVRLTRDLKETGMFIILTPNTFPVDGSDPPEPFSSNILIYLVAKETVVRCLSTDWSL